MNQFEGPLNDLWEMPDLPNIKHLTWDWWWWLVMWPSKKHPGRSEQLMVLWSTKETPSIYVNEHHWAAGTTANTTEEDLVVLPGMIAGWYFDGEKMYEPLVLQESRIAALSSKHKDWPIKSEKGGGVFALCEQLLSTGMSDDGKKFWMRIESDKAAVKSGSPKQFDIQMTPWNTALSTARRSFQKYQNNMGYDILRIHGCKAIGEIDNEKFEGSAYLQKVRVQAPTVPWYWGILHFSDGSYLDWYLPHLSLLALSSSNKPWQFLDSFEVPLKTAGLFHDAERQRSENFTKLKFKKIKGNYQIKNKEGVNEELPRFEIEMWNGRTMIVLSVEAISRAHWSFDQHTRGGIFSHFCYNEYPLKVTGIAIEDEFGIRTLEDWEWIHGNAEHSWGILH